MWHLGFPTGNWTHVPCIARQILNNWTPREVSRVVYSKDNSPNNKGTSSGLYLGPHIQWNLSLLTGGGVVWSLSSVWLFATPWTVARQAPLSSSISQSLLKFMSIEFVILPYHLILCHSLLLWPSLFPSIRVFPVSRLFASSGQSIRDSASAAVLPMNIQGWFPQDWRLISLQSKGLSRIFSSTTIQKHQSIGTQPSLRFNPHIHSFDYMDLCQQSDVSGF